MLPRGERAEAPPERLRDSLERHHVTAMIGIALVAVEELVGALAALDDDRARVARELRDEVLGDRGRIGGRLVLVVDHARQEPHHRLGVDQDLVMVGPEPLGDQPRVPALVVARVLVGGDRERPHRLVDQLRHQRDVGGRVDAAGQEYAERDVGHHPFANRLPQELAEPLHLLVFGHLADLSRHLAGERRPVAGALERAVGSHDQSLGRRQLRDAAVHRRRRRREREREVVEERLLVEVRGIAGCSSSALTSDPNTTPPGRLA